jgi:hypothetical protein
MQEEMLMSYLAGLMDGDGSFSLQKLKNVSRSPLYFPVLQFGFQKEEIVNVFKQIFGGTIHKIDPLKDKRYRQPFFLWRLRSTKNVIPVVDKLIKYLVLKKERAQFLLNFCKNFSFIRGIAIEQDVLVERERSYLKMGQLNDCREFVGIEKTRRPVKNESCPLFWSYVAGIIDSDGSFSVKKQKYQYGQRYNAVISIDMVDPMTIGHISSRISYGRVEANRVKACTNGICYRLTIGKKEEIIAFLNSVMPFLRVKKNQGEVLLDFCLKWKNTGFCKAGVPAEEMAFREECHQKIKQLNKYGVYKPTLIDLEA